jgi:imidazolonepropionase-like amidohydrolase
MRLATAAVALATAIALCATAWPARSQQTPERWYVLHCGALLAVPGQAPLVKVSVIVKGERIQEVRNGFVEAKTIERPRDVKIETLDLREAFVLPGLIDAHVHITLEERPLNPRNDRTGDADVAIRSLVVAENLLRAGFTTLRDLGSSGRAIFALRDAIRERVVVGPRLVVAGEPITPTGGHSDPRLSMSGELMSAPGPAEGIADGPYEVRKAVRIQIERGADVIKVTATGGVLSASNAGTDQQLLDDELKEAVQVAHMLGRRVAAHAHGAAGIKAALRAGVDSIEHGTFLDDDAIGLFKQTGAFLVPAVMAGETVAERAKIAGYYPPAVQQKALEVGPRVKKALSSAHAAGVKIAFGTDSGVPDHGSNAREFVYMVQAGLSEMEAIRSATVGGAELLGLSREIGSVEPGKLADLVATQRNPLVDITELQRVVFVMKSGRPFKNDLPGAPPVN